VKEVEDRPFLGQHRLTDISRIEIGVSDGFIGGSVLYQYYRLSVRPRCPHLSYRRVPGNIDLHLFLIKSDAWLMSATTGGTVLLEGCQSGV